MRNFLLYLTDQSPAGARVPRPEVQRGATTISLIKISNLTFAYDGSPDYIFENVSFGIDTSWKLGFTGRNGRGKTTFLKLLQGKYEYRGSITSNVDFEYFPFEVPPGPESTLEILRSIAGGAGEWELRREINLLELGGDVLERPFETLSEGERTKVLLAALFLKENRFLLIDEPTNHLDMHGREVVSEYLSSKAGFILVSHDRAFLDGCIDHILSINKTDIELQRGNFSSWLQNKERRDNFELAENDKLKKEIGRLSDAGRRTAAWSDKLEKTKYATDNSGLKPDRGYIGHKSAKMMSRAKAIEGRRRAAAEEKAKLLKNIESAQSLKISQPGFYTKRFVELDDVAIFYGDKKACGGVKFTVERGDRIAICGKNGAGKSSVLKLICGGELSYSGRFQKASRLITSYVPQDTSFLRGNLTDYAMVNGIDESLFKAILRKLDFSRTQFEKDMSDFSSGQKKKVLIAGSLCMNAHLLVWDEPLNFIDVLSRMQLESLLLSYNPTIVFVEHDREFCRSIATKTVEL